MKGVNVVEEAPRLPFAVRLPSAAYRLAWGGAMLALGASLTRVGFTGIDVVPLLALLAGASSNWSG